MKLCENCNSIHDGKFASGRFCSSKCSKSFSTKSKRKEINEKVSKAIKEKIYAGETIGCAKKIYDTITKKCKVCNNIFTVRIDSKKEYCKEHAFTNEEYRKKCSIKMINDILSGKRDTSSFGKSIKCIYHFKDKNIRCDSKLEHNCLFYLEKHFNVIDIERCNFSIPYIDFEGNDRKYIPDFIVNIDNDIYVVECKYDKVNYILNEKWKHYVENSSIKKNSLEEFCKANGYKMLWYTNLFDRNYKKYKVNQASGFDSHIGH